MNAKLLLLVRVIAGRIEKGEDLGAVLDSYPKLTDLEKAEVQKALGA